MSPHFTSSLCVLTLVVAVCSGASSVSVDQSLAISNVKRSLDLQSQLVKITDEVTLEGTTVDYFLFAVDEALQDKLSYIGAEPKQAKRRDEDEEEDDYSRKLGIEKVSLSGHADKTIYRVALPPGSKRHVITVEHVYVHAVTPHPSHITQTEKQSVKYEANIFFYSPYPVVKQQCQVKLPSDKVESYSKVKPTLHRDSGITYGPYENKLPFSKEEVLIHYENNNPFLTVTNLERLVEVSHWGNIAIEETVDILHEGAVLKGPFSRYDFQRDPGSGLSSVKSYKTALPASARDIYYRDEIGNISTSHVREYDEYVEVELRPRFPLFGGWKTHYTLGYNLPSYEYLFNTGDSYVLKVRFIDHIFDDAIYDRVTVKVVLPEGSKGIELSTVYPVTRGDDESLATYLDTVGRPVVVMHKTNLVEQHIQDFQIRYSFRKLLMLREPLLVVAAFIVLFITVIVYVRLDFSISKDVAGESKMRVAGYVEQIQSLQDRRSATYQSYEDAVNKYKQSKDNNKFQTDKKKVDADYKYLSNTVAELLPKLKQEGTDASDKVSEVQKLDKQIKEHIMMSIGYAEKLVSGKMNKQQYLDMEKACKQKRDEFVHKIESMVSSM